MKTKFILPIIAIGLFAACSDDSSSDNPTEPGTDPTVESSTSEETPSSDSTPLEPFRKEVENTIPNNTATEVEDFADYKYYGAELTGKDQFTYGRFEARMKMVSISGSVSSMFLYYDPSYLLGSEPWNEIDIEVLGTNPGMWQSNLITRLPDEDKKNPKITSEYKTGFGFNSTEDFHLFAFVWTPEYISWEIDSVEIRRDVIGMDKGQVEFMTLQQSLRFNLWASKAPAGQENSLAQNWPMVQWRKRLTMSAYTVTTQKQRLSPSPGKTISTATHLIQSTGARATGKWKTSCFQPTTS